MMVTIIHGIHVYNIIKLYINCIKHEETSTTTCMNNFRLLHVNSTMSNPEATPIEF